MVTGATVQEMKNIQPEAQLIFDRIWLGPIDVARSKEQLDKLGITAIVSVLGPD